MRILVSLLTCALLVTGCAGTDETTDSSSETSPTSKNSTSLSQSPGVARTSRWAVVGVRHDDKLNVRRQPRASAPAVARLAPLATGVKVLTKTSGPWRQVRVKGRTGWAHGRYLAQLGKAVEVSDEGRDVGIAPTGLRLARKVAARQAEGGDGPLTGPVLVAREGRTYTLDVLGYADDSVVGERFVVTVEPGEAGFQVRTLRATPMCARGVDRAGLCR
jgi:uncharacterized protein YraI